MVIKLCCPKFNQFFAYSYDKYIMTDSTLPPKMWGKFDKNIDNTTNYCESFHIKLN